MKCVIYARVSSKEQEKEGFSIPAQQKLLSSYARKNGLTVVGEFTDVETAKAAGRTKFGQMVAFLKEHRDVKAILVEKTDRLYRNFRDYVLLEDLDMEIHLVKENEVISKNSRSHAKFIHGIKVLMAKNYIDNLSEEVKKGMREKAEQGEWPAKAPIGYTNDKVAHRVAPDAFRAPLVKQLFELYSTGRYSMDKLRDMMHAAGLTGGNGRKLSKSMIEGVLKNRFYYGEFDWGGQSYQGIHEPIISRELFDRVQDVLGTSGKPRSRVRSFAFKGLLKCAKCGSAIVGEIKKEKYVYYHCTSARGKCSQPYVREEVLDGLLAETLKAIQVTPRVAHEIVTALKDHGSQERVFREGELSRLRKRYDDLQRRLDKSYEDRLDGVVDECYWRDVSAKWRTEQDNVARQIECFQKAGRSYIDTAVEILELAQQAYPLYVSREREEKRQLLNAVLSNCTIDGLTVCPTYKNPFNLIAEGVNLQFKLPRQDSNLRPAD